MKVIPPGDVRQFLDERYTSGETTIQIVVHAASYRGGRGDSQGCVARGQNALNRRLGDQPTCAVIVQNRPPEDCMGVRRGAFPASALTRKTAHVPVRVEPGVE